MVNSNVKGGKEDVQQKRDCEQACKKGQYSQAKCGHVPFGPEQSLMTFVMNEILCAYKSIDIEVYLITSKRIANRIVKAHEAVPHL